MSFEESICVVTGAGSGIGYALCHELAARGATVHGADLDPARLRASERSDRIVGHEVDVSDECAVEDLLDGVAGEQGRLDFVFNNAGMVVGGPFEEMDRDAWRRIVDVNFW